MALNNIQLPAINDHFQAHLADVLPNSVSPVNMKLPLPVLTEACVDDAAKSAAAWACNKSKGFPAKIRIIYCAGAALCIKTGLVRKVGDFPDGEWYNSGSGLWDPIHISDSEVRDIVSHALSKEMMNSALNIIVATKLKWWLYNLEMQFDNSHKVDYVWRELESIFGSVNDDHVMMANSIASWASTLHVLDLAGVSGIREYSKPLHTCIIYTTLSTSTKKLFELPPAGSVLEFAFESIKLLMQSPLARLCPGVVDFKVILDTFIDMTGHHIQAPYLSGISILEKNLADWETRIILGRLGSYISIMHQSSHLAKSPHVTWLNLQSYADYSQPWSNILTEYKKIAATSSSCEAFEEVKKNALAIVDDTDLDPIRKAFQRRTTMGQEGIETSLAQKLQQSD